MKLTRRSIAQAIADQHRPISAELTYAIVSETFDKLTEGLRQLREVEIRGLGAFRLRQARERIGRAVFSGPTPRGARFTEPAPLVRLPAHLKVVFKPSKQLRLAVAKRGAGVHAHETGR